MAIGDITTKANLPSSPTSLRSEAVDVGDATRQLSNRTYHTETLKLSIAAGTLVHLGSAAAFAVFVLLFPIGSTAFSLPIFLVCCLASLFGTFYETLNTMRFDLSRRAGNDLYSDISDAFQSSDLAKIPEVRRQLLNNLKCWLRASDMPLVPGPYGPAVYLLLNLLATVGFFVIAFTHK